MIPQNFDEWVNCITNDCKINLTKEFARERLAVYQNEQHEETMRFVSLYGKQHLDNIINWFNRV